MAEGNSTTYRDIPGWPGYRVGDDGSVWRRWVNCRWGRRLTDKWRQMKIGTHWKGYLYVNLTPADGGKYKTFRVHRLVLEAFVGPCPEGMECRHLNGVKADCRLMNLAWGTQERNRQDNHDAKAYAKGAAHTQAKLTEDAVRDIRARRAAGEPARGIAADYGITQSTVSNIVHRRSWTHI